MDKNSSAEKLKKNNLFFEIDGIKVGPEYPPLVIAEIGINHNGSLELAKTLADSAHNAGVKIFKHQTHIAEYEMSKEAKKIIPVHTKENIYDIIKNCSLSEEEEYELMVYVRKKGMTFISTPFSKQAADRLRSWDVPAYKIGSGECNNYPLLDYIASFGKPIILSTGMNTIESISKAISIIKRHSVPYAILHTTNLYPTPNHLVRLGAITDLINTFPDTIVGLSDHTISNHSSFGAVAIGASIIERHYTDTMNRMGPDIVCSMDENECKRLIEGVQILFKQRGGKKIPVKEEKDTSDFAFSSVVSIKKIKKGEKFSKENLWVKRPGTGEVKAENLRDIFGKTSLHDLEIDEFIKTKDFK